MIKYKFRAKEIPKTNEIPEFKPNLNKKQNLEDYVFKNNLFDKYQQQQSKAKIQSQ